MNGSLLFTYLWTRVLNKEIQSNTQQDLFFFILESRGIIPVSHLGFIWPSCCLASQESKSSFRKERKKVCNKKSDKRITLSQPAYDAKEGDCSCSPLPSPFQQPRWQICPVWLLLFFHFFSSFFFNHFNMTSANFLHFYRFFMTCGNSLPLRLVECVSASTRTESSCLLR